jgi:hypothetical protein
MPSPKLNSEGSEGNANAKNLEDKKKKPSNHSIRHIQTILPSGERVTLLGIGSSLRERDGVCQNIIEYLKNKNRPVRIKKGRGVYSQQEVVKYLRENSKVIVLDLSTNGWPDDPFAGREEATLPDQKMAFPEVLHWSSYLRLPPEVVLQAGQKHEFSMEELIREIEDTD